MTQSQPERSVYDACIHALATLVFLSKDARISAEDRIALWTLVRASAVVIGDVQDKHSPYRTVEKRPSAEASP